MQHAARFKERRERPRVFADRSDSNSDSDFIFGSELPLLRRRWVLMLGRLLRW
jgi:hypothetical protein